MINAAKESLTTIANKLTRKQVFILVLIFGFICTFIYSTMNVIVPYFQNEEKIEKRVQNEREKIAKQVIIEQEAHRQTKDSIKEAEQIRKQKLAYVNIDKIYDLMEEVHRKIPTANTIAIYYLHDSGGVPISGSALNITVLYEETDKGVASMKKDWQSVPLPEGYFHYNKFIYDYGQKYVNDVTAYSKIYHGETIEILKYYSTKSLYGVLLEQSTAGTYYFSIGFDHVDPVLKDPLLRNKANSFAARIRPLLQVKIAPIN